MPGKSKGPEAALYGNRKKPKVVDLFAGCGGLSLGLEQAGFEPVFVNELNTDARNTYIKNRQHLPWFKRKEKDPPTRFEAADVKSLVANPDYLPDLLKNEFGLEHGELDLLVGGPPCQGFSGIGHRRSYSVEKEQLPSNHLYQDMAALIFRLQPKVFLFENVRGILNAKWNGDGEKAWDTILETFQSIKGYSVAFELVYAKHYGVPQNRPRVLMVGIRDDVKADIQREGASDQAIARGYLPKGDRSPPDLTELLGDLVDPKYVNGLERTEKYPKAAKGIQQDLRGKSVNKNDPVSEHEYSKHNDRIVEKFKAMQANGGVVPEEFQTKKFAQRVLPAKWTKAGPTITATSLPDDYVHFSQPRILTVREWARLQMFPDSYEFSGKRTTGGIRRAGNPRENIFDREVPKYTQIGNAVPVGLAHAVGEHLHAILRPKARKARG